MDGIGRNNIHRPKNYEKQLFPFLYMFLLNSVIVESQY